MSAVTRHPSRRSCIQTKSRRLISTLLVVALAGGIARGAPSESDAVGDYETGDFSQWVSVQPTWRKERASIVTRPVRHGRFAARFEVRAGDSVPSGGELSQVYWTVGETGGREGAEWFYAWSTYIPGGQRWKGDLDWNVLTEWLSPAGCPAPIQIGVFPSTPPRLYLDATHIRAPNATECDIQDRRKWFMRLATDRWMDFVLHVRWSSDSKSGFLEVWQDGVQVVPRTAIATLYPGHGVYLKQGFYRSEATFTNVVFNDEVRRAERVSQLPRSFAPWRSGSSPKLAALRRSIERTGRSWETFLRGHPELAREAGVPGISLSGERFYTKLALSDWLAERGIRLQDWVAGHRDRAHLVDWQASEVPYAAIIADPVLRDGRLHVRVRSALATAIRIIARSPDGRVAATVRSDMPPDGQFESIISVPPHLREVSLAVRTTRARTHWTLRRVVRRA